MSNTAATTMNGLIGRAVAAKRGRPIGALTSSPTVGTDGPLGAALKRVEVLRAAADAAREQGDFAVAAAALAKVDAQLADLEAGRLRDAETGQFVSADGEPLTFDGGVQRKVFTGRRTTQPTAGQLFAQAMSASRAERAERGRPDRVRLGLTIAG